ncbi:MAG: hypothetical protein LBL36_01900, partial [Clostridiales Family XIII bacterium]|nr:hypothetical protein [Clostridiales Family XIII bacterium]
MNTNKAQIHASLWKRVVGMTLALLMVLAMLPLQGFSAVFDRDAPRAADAGVFSGDDNGYIKYGVDVGSGGFYILPSIDDFDGSKPLSRATFLIDGEAVVFGALTGGEEAAIAPASKNESGATQMSWRYRDYTVTQYLNIIQDGLNEESYAVSVGYNIVKDGEAAELPMRVALDTRFGANDDQPVMTEVGGAYIMHERAVEPAPENFRMDAYRSENESVAYAILNDESFIAPERVTFADFAHLASGDFDYEPDTSHNFTEGDSGAALYYTVTAGAEDRDAGFVYGFMGLTRTAGSPDTEPAALGAKRPNDNNPNYNLYDDSDTSAGLYPNHSEKLAIVKTAEYDSNNPYLKIDASLKDSGYTITLSWTDGTVKSATVGNDEYYEDGIRGYCVNIPNGTIVTAAVSGSGIYKLATFQNFSWTTLTGNSFTFNDGMTLRLRQCGTLTLAALPSGISDVSVNAGGDGALNAAGTLTVTVGQTVSVSAPPTGYRWYFTDGNGGNNIDGDAPNNVQDDLPDQYYSNAFDFTFLRNTTLTLEAIVPQSLTVRPGTGIESVTVTPSGGSGQSFTAEGSSSGGITAGTTVEVSVTYAPVTDISGPVYND